MFTRNIHLRNIFHQNIKNFANHSKLILIGAGTGGISVANQLTHGKNFKKSDITIFDPAEKHYYQPGFTKIAGIPKLKDRLLKHIVYDMRKITKDFNFRPHAVKEFDPDNNSILDTSGEKWSYDYLVVAAGLKTNLDSIPGKINNKLN